MTDEKYKKMLLNVAKIAFNTSGANGLNWGTYVGKINNNFKKISRAKLLYESSVLAKWLNTSKYDGKI